MHGTFSAISPETRYSQAVFVWMPYGSSLDFIWYGKEQPPPEVMPKTIEEAKAEQEIIEKAKAGELVEKSGKAAPAKGETLRTFNVFVDDEHITTVKRARTGIFKGIAYKDYPNRSKNSLGDTSVRQPHED